MEITIKIGPSVSDQAKIRLLNELWTQAETLTAGDFNMSHDGGPGLSQRCNAEFDRWASIRWH